MQFTGCARSSEPDDGSKVSRREDVPPTTADEGLAASAGSSSSARIAPIEVNSQCSAAGGDAFAGKDTAKPFGAAAAARAVERLHSLFMIIDVPLRTQSQLRRLHLPGCHPIASSGEAVMA